MPPVRLNPPEPLSLAAHFALESAALMQEHQRLEELNLYARGLGYNFENHPYAMHMLRHVLNTAKDMQAKHGDEESEVLAERWLNSAILYVVNTYNIPVLGAENPVVLELSPKP
jgi:hypothetical protein